MNLICRPGADTPGFNAAHIPYEKAKSFATGMSGVSHLIFDQVAGFDDAPCVV